ncbi:MAG: hypothetical protein SFU55_00155 [Methylophilus sp.]|nr:hypothetical protein [Methylophilus sp.]
MKILEHTPFWVKLVYANIRTRKSAIWMIISCIVFAFYSIPWSQLSGNPLVVKLFLIHDWTWSISMVPLTIWYWLALRWVDQHTAWEEA